MQTISRADDAELLTTVLADDHSSQLGPHGDDWNHRAFVHGNAHELGGCSRHWRHPRRRRHPQRDGS